MADRFPLIANSSANQIQEIPSGDQLNLSGNNIANAGIITATSFHGSGANLTALNASNIGSGTVPDARFPATLPAASAANLTSIPAGNLTGALPAISGANLTGVGAGKLLKIHYYEHGTSTTITTPTRGDTGLAITFTPEALNSKFYIQFHQVGLNGVSSDQALFNLYLMRSIAGGTATELQEYYYLGNFTTNDRAYHVSALAHYDNPSYSAGQTLNYHIEVGFYTGNYNLNYSAQNGQLKSTIYVYEMGA